MDAEIGSRKESTVDMPRRRKRSSSSRDVEIKSSGSCKKPAVETPVANKTSNADGDLKVQVKGLGSHHRHSRHVFETNVLDHCETPPEAYEHLSSFLEVVGKFLAVKPAANLVIWDPYYCDGSVKRIFGQMGYSNVIHDNVDFYQLIRENKIPNHEILISNPPYSSDHIHRLLDFVVTREVPNQRVCCLLLPNWVSRQPDYGKRFADILEKEGHELFYLSPVKAYTYTMPPWIPQEDRPDHVGSSGKTTPYLSSWYLVVPKEHSKQQRLVLDRMDTFVKQQRPPVWVVAKTVKGLKWKIKNVHKKQNAKANGTAKRR